MKLTEFFRRWKDGIKNLSVERQLKAQLSGGYGNILGFAGGLVTMIIMMFITGNWYWWWTILILAIALFITIIDIIGKKQQLVALIAMQDSIKQMELLNDSHKTLFENGIKQTENGTQ